MIDANRHITMGVNTTENHIKRFLRIVEKTISDNQMFGMTDTVLVGLSGGPDSVALLWCLKLLAKKRGFEIAAAHLNHGLRGAEAEADAAFAAELSARLNIPITVQTTDVRIFQKTHKLSLEEAARSVRYDFLFEVSKSNGYSKIALGHHADDNAELMLMNLLRGSGPAGLSGIPVARPIMDTETSQAPLMIVRPLMRLTKQDIYAFLKAGGLSWQTDYTNSDICHLRNRIRRELMPTLKQHYNPNIVETLNRLAAITGDEEKWIIDMLSPILEALIIKDERQCIVLSVPQLRKQPRPAARRLLRLALMRVKGDLRRITFQHVESALALYQGDKHKGLLDLPDRVRIELYADQLTISHGKAALRDLPSRTRRPPASNTRYCLETPGTYSLSDFRMTLTARIMPQGVLPDFRNSGGLVGYFDMDSVVFPLIVRDNHPGDKFKPLGTRGTQKLKKFFIDHKIPPAHRAKSPVLLSAGEIIWVMGHRIDDRYKVTPSTKIILKIELKLAEPIEGD